MVLMQKKYWDIVSLSIGINKKNKKVISLLTPSETLFSTYKPYIKEQDTWYIVNSEKKSGD